MIRIIRSALVALLVLAGALVLAPAASATECTTVYADEVRVGDVVDRFENYGPVTAVRPHADGGGSTICWNDMSHGLPLRSHATVDVYRPAAFVTTPFDHEHAVEAADGSRQFAEGARALGDWPRAAHHERRAAAWDAVVRGEGAPPAGQ